MNYFFILGNHPELSTAELTASLDFKSFKVLDNVLLGKLDSLKSQEVISRLGGTIKIGRLFGKVNRRALYDKLLGELLLAPKTSKFNFGLSLYGKAKLNTYKLGLDLKSALKAQGVSCRLVVSREKNLSSVVVEQNKLVSSGRELVIMVEGYDLWLGITEAVQPFKDLSARDYGRPGRDDYSGMLPPKLAQIMINLARAKKDEIILDPFCGSGTILTEGLLMGYKKLAGSDISKKALDDSKKNLEWISKRYNLKYDLRLSLTDAKFLAKDFKDGSLGAIVTETYLGPQRGKFDLNKMSQELSKNYSDFLIVAAPLLKNHSRLVIALPAFLSGKKNLAIKIPISLIKKDSFLYGRAGQRVFRQILVLEKGQITG
jgi:tRNA G10  N-methylase Trm11